MPTAGGVAVLLRGLLLRSLVKEYVKNDGLPPECVALEFPAHVFGTIGQNVVILLAYVPRPGKVTNACKQKYGMDLFSLISRFIIELRNRNKQVILLGDLNAYTTAAIGWNGRDALWSDTADVILVEEVLACIRLSTETGETYSGFVKRASRAS